MADRLLIRLQPDGTMTWLAQDAAGRPLSESNTGAPPPATIARARRIIALVPSVQVALFEADAVSPRRAQLVKAIPFALEDQLASPVEELHFALAERISAGRVIVAVAARGAMRAWIDVLAAAGIRADVMTSESLALAASETKTTVLIESERALLRGAGALAVGCDTAALPQWLAIAGGAAVEVNDFRAAPGLALPGDVASYRDRLTDPLAFIARQFAAEPAVNLLQGEFAPSHRHAPAARLWRRAGLLTAAAAALALLLAGIDYLHLRRESDRLDAAQRDVLRTSLPDLAAVAGDPRSLMQSALTRLRGDTSGGGLLPMLARIGPIFASTTRVQLRSLEYRNATLELGLRAPDVPALDLVREQIAGLGLKAEVTAANSGDKGVDGRLRVAGSKP